MGMRTFGCLLGGVGAAALIAGCSSSSSDPVRKEAEAATPSLKTSGASALRRQFPNGRTEARGDVSQRVFGQKLAEGATPLDAATRFSAQLASALAGSGATLEPQEIVAGEPVKALNPSGVGLGWDPQSRQYKFRLFRFGQTHGGLPVANSEVLALVKQGGNNPVVWGTSRLRSVNGLRQSALAQRPAAPDLSKTVRSLRPSTPTLSAPTSVRLVGAPKTVVYAGAGDRQDSPRVALSYVVESASPPGKWRVLADATTRDIISSESLILFEDAAGTVTGLATTGVKAADCADELPTALPFAEVTSGVGNAFADASGAFTLPVSGGGPVTLGSLPGGRYFDVVDVAQAAEQLSLSSTPPAPFSFVHNADNTSALVRAEVNGYVDSNQIRSFLLTYMPDYPTISSQLDFPVNVNRTDGYCPGNAWYDYSSINFCQGSSSYGNTSFGSVNHHEYGHHIVTSGGSGQGAYGEGMADSIALLYAEDPGLGYGFYLGSCASPLRTADNTCQYSASACSSCGSEAHACGNLISGTVWSIWKLMAQSHPETYKDTLRSLVLGSVPMHTGTSIDASIAVDLLTLDDDDGNLDNGTPHYAEICGSFAAHGMQCPPILAGLQITSPDTLSSAGPVGGPFAPSIVAYTLKNYGPATPVSYQVNAVGSAPWLTIGNASGQLALGQEAQVTVGIDQAAAAALPKGKYQTTLNFVNSSGGGGGGTRSVSLEVGAPSVVFSENFSGGLGSFTLDAGATNLWHASSACAASASGHSAPNGLFFGLDSTCTFNNGLTQGSVTSPSIAISDPSTVKVGLNYYLITERNSSYDKATLLASVNGGAYTVIAKNGTTTDLLVDGNAAWQRLDLDISSLFPPGAPATLRLRASFDSVDSVLNDYAGFWIDDVEVRAFNEGCSSNAQCSDGLFCNGVESCVQGVCVAGTPVQCDDSVSCTIDACDEAADSCTHQTNDSACNDNNACNGVEACSPTGCVAGQPLNCDDGNSCTTDSCNATLGCQFANNTATCADDGNSCTSDVCSAGACTHPQNGSCSTGPFVESGGQVVIEAEHFTTNTARASHNWASVANASASGGQVMRSDPNNGANVNTGYTTGSPQLDFPIQFTTTGTYNVWLRGLAATGDDDSCHVGLDGQGPASSDRISTFGTSLGWTRATMDGPVATIVVSTPGVHTLNLWMREDGLVIDRLLLTTNGSFTPSGAGPAESPRGGTSGCTNNAACDDGNPCTNDACAVSTGVCTHTNNTATCADDGSACTNDVCAAGVCTHPQNGSCGSTPCASFCTNPVVYTANPYQAANLGNGATCHETTAPIVAGNCGNLVSPRKLTVNGTTMTCNSGTWSSLPPKVNGGYCIQTTAGNESWAWFTTW